jgi:hypothetical protein
MSSNLTNTSDKQKTMYTQALTHLFPFDYNFNHVPKNGLAINQNPTLTRRMEHGAG